MRVFGEISTWSLAKPETVPSLDTSTTAASMTSALCSLEESPIRGVLTPPSRACWSTLLVSAWCVMWVVNSAVPSTPASTRPATSIMIATNSLRRRASMGVYPSKSSRR